MSSSVFIESSSQAADSSEYAGTSDSNLVVVYGKNGISFDDKGLENLIEEKKISSISVIRLTSPTPSMKDEDEEAEKLEEMLRKQDLGSGEDSCGSEDEGNSSSANDRNDSAGNDDSTNEENEDRKNDSDESSDENKSRLRKQPRRRGRQANVTKQKKISRRRKRERPEIVGLRLEEFYPPEDAKEIIKEALKMAGLEADKKSKSDYEFQLFVIQNDHCYTPFTSPTQMKAKLAADKLEAEKQGANRKANTLQTSTGKQLFVRKKQIIPAKSEGSLKSNVASTSTSKDKNLSGLIKRKDLKDKKAASNTNEDFVEDDENIHSSGEENEDETAGGDDESDNSGGSEESAESDNDRDSDLDFDVNNPKGRKRKTKLLKTSQRRSLNTSKTNQKTLKRYCSQDEPAELLTKSTTTPAITTSSPSSNVMVQRQKSIVKVLPDTSRITVRSTPSKIVHMMGPSKNVLSPVIAALPPIPKKQTENKTHLPTTTNAAPTTVTLSPKTYVLVKGPLEQKSTTHTSPQTHKEIVINKQVMSSPKTKGFTDLTTLIEQTEKQTPPPPNKTVTTPTTPKSSSHTATITSVVTLTPTSAAAVLKGFMPIDTAAKNQLPAQISIQTHQSSSELEAEHDKQLDLINSIVQDEMQKSNEKANEQITNINENIPELVKMLESTEKVLVNTTNTQNRNVTASVTQQNIHQPSSSNISNERLDNKPIISSQNVNMPQAPVTMSTSSASSSANNIVGGIDITSASLLATPEGEGDDNDDLPDDILQQVVELIKDDKTLQEAVEKQVFGTGGVCNEPSLTNNMLVNQNPPPLAPISQHPIRLQEPSLTPAKSIIQMAITNVPTTLNTPLTTKPKSTVVMTTHTPSITTTNTLATSTPAQTMGQIPRTSPLIRKEPIQIIRGNGRVITLPPIEAPTTRAKRRAQAQPVPATTTTTTSSVGNTTFMPAAALSESSMDSSIHSNSSMTMASGSSAVSSVQEKKTPEASNRRRGSKENITAAGANQKATKAQKTAAKKGGSKASAVQKAKVETEATDSEDDDDDPNKLWCICRQPHNNRFMICCDVCEDWFHGTCVSITKAMGLEMEQKGIDWTCPKCIKKQEDKKQPKITEMLIKKPTGQPEMPLITTSTPVVIATTTQSLITSVIGTVPSTMVVQNKPTTNVTSSTIDILNITPKKDGTVQNLDTQQIKLQSGQIINLKDYSTTTNKRATIIQTSTSNTTVGLTAGQKKLFVTSGQGNLKMTTQPGTPIRTITVVKQLSNPQQQQSQQQQQLQQKQQQQHIHQQQHPQKPQYQQQHQHQQHHNIKIVKTIAPATTTTGQINTTTAATTSSISSPATSVSSTSATSSTDSSTLCIVCKKIARANSIYCSDDCIRKHAQNALNNLMNKSQSESGATSSPLSKGGPEDKTKKKPKGLFEELLSAADRKPKVERVNVYERKSGRVITGNNAPTTANLKKWLQDNPTFEVIQPGSTQALDLEKKQKLRTQHSSSPNIIKSATSSPPPLKMFFSTTTNTTTNKTDNTVGTTHQAHSPQIQTKTNRTITDYLKSTSSTSPRPSTPKQLQKYPQQVGIKPDKVPKTPDETKAANKEKTSAAKRQTSTETSSKTSSHDGEPIRLVVRRTLKEQLLLRIKEESASPSTSSETEGKDDKTKTDVPKLTEEEVEEFAKTTELEMYNYFNRDTGIKYKAKYRSLVFNIKDRKNHTLFAKICGKLIEPKQLVRMSPEEMASQELAQWREQEAKHQLEMIKKSELDLLACAKNYVLKTHKGEEVIEGKSSDYANVDITIPVEDVVSALNNSELPDEATTPQHRKDSTQTHWSDADSSLMVHSHSLLDTTLQDEDKNRPSSSHSKDKDRAEREKEKDREREKDRSRGRDREREKRHKSKDRHHDKSRSRKRSRSRSRSRSRDRGEKRHKSSHKDEKREREDRARSEKERIKDRERDHSDGSEKKTSVAESKKTTVAQTKQTAKKAHEQQKASINPLETYNLIDQILESTKTVEEAANLVTDKDKESENYRKTAATPQPVQTATSTVSTSSSSADSAIVIDIPANVSSTESDQEPTSTVSIPTPPHDPYSRFIACSSPSIYGGDLQYRVTSLWTGNINMVDVTSFQLTIQPIVGNSMGLAKLLPKELDVVGRIGPETVWDYISKIKKSPNKEIVVIRLIPSNETETLAYKILYEYLDNRNRLGVIRSTSSQIKDFYIYPLGAGKDVPPLLQPTEPVDFYDDPYRPDVLIGIIVRVIINKRPNPIVTPAGHGGASTSAVLSKLAAHDLDPFTPPGSPKPKKLRPSLAAHKVDEIDIDAIIKAPIVAKSQKAVTVPPLTKLNPDEADEPYSPGGSSDDDLPLLPVKVPSNNVDHMQAAEDELKRKMEEINRQIAAQEMEIAGLLTGEPTAFGTASAATSNVLANISIPSNLSQILASIKAPGKDQSVVPPPPPLIGSLLKPSTSEAASSTQVEEYNPAEALDSTYETKTTATGSNSNSTSLLAKLSEAELLSMVPDDIVISPNKPTRYEEPPPPGV